MDLITSLSIELEYFIYLVMVTCHLKRATINEAYIKKTKRKRVANATPINSIGFLKTPTNYIEPESIGLIQMLSSLFSLQIGTFILSANNIQSLVEVSNGIFMRLLYIYIATEQKPYQRDDR